VTKNLDLLPLRTVNLSHAAQVGRKAAALGTLLHAGFPVPPGLCLSAEAFRLALGTRRDPIDAILRAHDLHDPAGARVAADSIGGLLADLCAPTEVARALREALPAFADPSTPLAVRSSATAEDAARFSYAGQYHTALGVCGFDALLEAILACWRSFYTAHALSARAAGGGLGPGAAMALLVQPMIDAECGGVCYSLDPVAFTRDRIVVSAAWGLGAGLADGTVAADTLWITRDGFRVDRQRIPAKSERIALHPSGGVQLVPVPDDRVRMTCLPDRWGKQLAQFAVAAETLLGAAQDVEWAIAARQVWVLQSGPMTGLPGELVVAPSFPVTWDREGENRRFWEIYELDERRREALLPLEIGGVAVVESVREETCRWMGADRNLEMAVHHGRIYTTPIPIGIDESDVRVRRQAREDLKQRLWDEGRTAWDRWGPEIERATERLRAFDADDADGPALAEHLEDALGVRRRHYGLHPSIWFKPQPPYFAAFERISGLSGEAAAYRAVEGEESVVTALYDSLYALAETARQTPTVATLVRDPPPDALDQFRALPEAATFYSQLDALLDAYGDRTGRGYGFEPTIATPTWRDRPASVLRLVALYMGADLEPPWETRARSRDERNAWIDALCAACADREAVAEFRRQLVTARRWTTLHDTHNHYLDQMGLGQLRAAALAAGRWLAEQGALEAQEDVLWLTFDEILSALREETPRSLAGIIAERRAEYAEWIKLEAPPILGVPPAGLPPRPPLGPSQTAGAAPQPTGALVTGVGASRGTYVGRVHLALDPAVLPSPSPGDVLVADNASPMWTPLFPVLGAIVLDSGGLGQHAAATAREFGIPAVVNTGDGTRRIPDGTRVAVDGTLGTVSMVPD